MLKNLFLLFLMMLAAGFTKGQAKKNSQVIVVGKYLSGEDSLKVREFFLSGIKEKALQRADEAAGYFRAVLEIDPANAAALYEVALICHAQNDDVNAEQLARRAVTVEAGNKWYWLLLADIYKKTGKLSELVLVFDELIRLEPRNDDYYFDKANALVLSNKLKDAEKLYTEIEKVFGESAELSIARQQVYQSQGNTEKAEQSLKRVIQENPGGIRSYLELADVYLKDGKQQKALEILLEASTQAPDNPFVHLSLGEVYKQLGKREEAFAQLKTAAGYPGLNVDTKVRLVLSLFPEFKDPFVRAQAEEISAAIVKAHPTEAKALSLYGDVLFQNEKLNEAKATYKKALKLNDQVYLIWEQLLRIEIASQDFKSAIADGEEALSIFPNQAPLNFYTAIAYSQVVNPEKAIYYLKAASELEAEDKQLLTQIYSSLGDSYNAVKKFQESDEAYDKALTLDPSNTYVLNNYAYYLSLRGRSLDKAAEMSKYSNELQPDNASFQDTYAWVLFKQKKFAEARTWMEKAIKNNSNSGVQFEHYGDILFNLGEKDLAIQQWVRAKEKGVKSGTLDKKINEKKFFE